jgi:hypothetical protein
VRDGLDPAADERSSEAGWARVIALRLGIDPNSLRVALIDAVVVAAAAIGRPVAVSQDAAAVLQRQSAVHA